MNNSPNHDLRLQRLIDRVLIADDIQTASAEDLEARLDATNAEPFTNADVDRILAATREQIVEAPQSNRDSRNGIRISLASFHTDSGATGGLSAGANPVDVRTGSKLPVAPGRSFETSTQQLPSVRRRPDWAFAAVVASLACVVAALTLDVRPPPAAVVQSVDRPQPTPIVAEPLAREPAKPAPAWTRLTARERSPAPPTERISVGSTLATAARERRRVMLPDGSVLFVNERSRVVVESARRLRLLAGEVFVEVVPTELLTANTREPFTVTTPDRRVTALGTKFAVSTRDAATGVVVAQGKVQVSGVEQPVEAGQRWISPPLAKGEPEGVGPTLSSSPPLTKGGRGGPEPRSTPLARSPPPAPPFQGGRSSSSTARVRIARLDA
jgi:hypothetical protein